MSTFPFNFNVLGLLALLYSEVDTCEEMNWNLIGRGRTICLEEIKRCGFSENRTDNSDRDIFYTDDKIIITSVLKIKNKLRQPA
jgi:hypothetical protein